MKPRAHVCLAALALWTSLIAGACEDDDGEPGRSGVADAPSDMTTPVDTRDTLGADGVDTRDAGVEDRRPSVDCGAVCRDQLMFTVASYIARFGDDGRSVDVTACLGSDCGSIRAERLGMNELRSGATGAPINVELSSDGVLTVHFRGGSPPDAEQQLQLRIVTTGGRQLIDYSGRATGQEHCPGGAGCVRCQAILVDIDPADAGEAVDSSAPGHCGT